MFRTCLKSFFIIIFTFITLITLSNYITLYKNHIDIKAKLALIYESVVLTKSQSFKLIDKFYYLKNKNNSIEKVFLDIEKSSLQKSKLDFKSENFNKKKKYYNSNISFDNGNNFQDADFRLRGNNEWHHQLSKPSIRVKLKKKEPHHMMRHINFTSPEGRTMIENYYSDLVSKQIGLMSHFSKMVELYINKQSYGLYHMHSREDESMVRLNKRMPAPLLVGKDLDEKWKINDFEIENINSISENQNIYSKFLNEIYIEKRDSNDWKNFWKVVNREQTAKFIAINTILGILHNDYKHNQEFFYDRTIGKVEPIISDALSLGTFVYPRGKNRLNANNFFFKEKPYYKTPINQKTNPLLNTILKDISFYHQKNLLIKTLIEKNLSYENQKENLKKIYNEIDNIVYKDKFKTYISAKAGIGWQGSEYSNYEYEIFKKNIFYFVNNRIKFLKDELNKNYIDIEIDKKNNLLIVRYKGELPLTIRSNVFEAKKIQLYSPELKKFVSIKPSKKYKITFHSGLKIVRNKNNYTNGINGQDIFHNHHYVTDYQTYVLKLEKMIEENDLKKIFKKNVSATPIKEINIINKKKETILTNLKYNQTVLHNWNSDKYKGLDIKHTSISTKEIKKGIKRRKNEIILGPGEVDIKENLVVDENQELIIENNTKILMWPNTSILSYGKVIADGENGQIEILRKFPEKAWGVFSLLGDKTSGSSFYNLKINGGSKANLDNIAFSGMVNIFWNEDIIFKNVQISGNILGDDTLHLTKSKGLILNSKISNCNNDCIDFDYSNYIVENLECRNSGNDGIDSMESTLYLKNVTISENLDKSISNGEASEIFLDNVKILNSNIGIAAKDQSITHLNNVLIKNTSIGIDIYRKNLRYKDSGKVFSKSIFFDKNKVDISTDNISKINFDLSNYKVIKK
jgi:hypothetical protein